MAIPGGMPVVVPPLHSRSTDADKVLAALPLLRHDYHCERNYPGTGPWNRADTTWRLVIISSRDLRGDYRPRQDKRTAQGRWEATG
jgi:hypothetical protein